MLLMVFWWGEHDYHPHFLDEELEVQKKLGSFLKVPRGVSRARSTAAMPHCLLESSKALAPAETTNWNHDASHASVCPQILRTYKAPSFVFLIVFSCPVTLEWVTASLVVGPGDHRMKYFSALNKWSLVATLTFLEPPFLRSSLCLPKTCSGKTSTSMKTNVFPFNCVAGEGTQGRGEHA